MARPRKDNVRIAVYLPAAAVDDLRVAAARQRVSRSRVIERALRVFLTMSDELAESLEIESATRAMTPAEIIAEAMSARIFYEGTLRK